MTERKATCHPEEKHHSKGLCKRCYTRQRMSKWRAENPEQLEKAKMRARSPEARERNKKAVKKYQETHREEINERSRERQALPERKKYSRLWREKNRERLKQVVRTWHVTNIEKVRTNRHRRRARLAGTDSPGVPPEVFEEKCREAEGRCRYCFIACDDLTREHVVPIARGGRDEPSNVIPVCPRCNKSKNDRLLSEWIGVRLDLLK